MSDLRLLRESRRVEAVDPALAAALGHVAEHERDDLMAALADFCSGARWQRGVLLASIRQVRAFAEDGRHDLVAEGLSVLEALAEGRELT